MKKLIYPYATLCIAILFLLLTADVLAQATRYTRGIGQYPGDDAENFNPLPAPDSDQVRNLALYRTVIHSSSYDYNLTGQLITDGIIGTDMPVTYSGFTSQDGELPKNQCLYLVDHNPVTRLPIQGSEGWIQISWSGPLALPVFDSLIFGFDVQGDNASQAAWSVELSGSVDGTTWTSIRTATGAGIPGDTISPAFKYFLPGNHRVIPMNCSPGEGLHHLRISFNAPAVSWWNIGGLETFLQGDKVTFLTSSTFTSAWMDTGNPQEWVSVDLGAPSQVHEVVLDWIRRGDGCQLQHSMDGQQWTDWIAMPESSDGTRDLLIVSAPVEMRYLRVLIKHTKAIPALLSELQVMGTGGKLWQPKPAAEMQDHKMLLSGGSWKLQRASEVQEEGLNLGRPGYNDRDWVTATVPGTVLSSFLNVEAIPDPNYGDNQLMVSESYFNGDFWYRNEFEVPQPFIRDRVFLQFKGINWKAEVYCNGRVVGTIAGAFTRSVFDVTDFIHPGSNAIAVKIMVNANPGGVKEQTAASPDLNGGVLGADNPAFHATIGWDWIPTIRGRDAGIWDDVLLTSTGPVTLEDPFVDTRLPLPSTDAADVMVAVNLVNHTNLAQEGILEGRLGEVAFQQAYTLQPNESRLVRFTPVEVKGLHLSHPDLWWPNGYGEPNLTDVNLKYVLSNGSVSDEQHFQTGLRQMTYSGEDKALRIYVNGVRFVPKGGNWGFAESMLRYRSREFDIAVRYHRDMNYTMIRNWVGMTGSDAFFDACDRYGIMVWQDFWLANPWDGPDPDDDSMFMANSRDFVHRIRNHPSIGLYCGRNEGNPPPSLNQSLANLVDSDHPGMIYFPHSAEGPVSGYGPYGAMPASFYFQYRATEKPHSELGMANIVSKESLDRMMPADAQWPIGRMWGIHDFCDGGAQNGAAYKKLMEINFGPIDQLEDWLSLAQFRNYEGYRAMYEAQSRNRMGLLIWMSHSAWPSFVWQTYDYYFEPTAAYFGVKKACEPLHIQWNASTDSIEVVNYSHPDVKGLIAQAELFDLNGALKWSHRMNVDSRIDSRQNCFPEEKPEDLTRVYFLRLKLMQGDEVLSENFYWRGPGTEEALGDNFLLRNAHDNDYSALRNLPKVPVTMTENGRQTNADETGFTLTVKNTGDRPALMIRLNVVGEQTGEQVLPVLYEDNYFSLMPGEQKEVLVRVRNEDTRGEKPVIKLSGFNVIAK